MIDYTLSSTIYVSATEGNDSYTGFAPHPVETEIGCVEGPILYIAHTKDGDRPMELAEWQSILGMDEGSICAPPDGFTALPDARIVYQ